MKKQIINLLLLFTTFLYACKDGNFDYHNAKLIGSVKENNIQSINIDSIKLDLVSTTFVGESRIFNGSIYYIDNKFSYIYKFSNDGKLIQRYAGQGDGQNELPVKTITFFTFLPNGNSIVIGPSWDCFIFDSNFNKINDYIINWHNKVSKEEMLKNPDPSNSQLYSLLYNVGDIKATNEYLYFPVASQHPKFNPTFEKYAEEARIFGKMRIKNGYVEKIFGKLSPVYSDNFNKLVMPYPLFDLINNDSTVFTFPTDSQIYLLDKNMNLNARFGVAGQSMDTNYVNTHKTDSFPINWKKETANKGYYTSIKYIPELNYVIRTYQKSGTAILDGMQIYKNEVLIADVSVPKGFKISGYISPYVYSNIYTNEIIKELKLYRIKLPK